MKLSTLQVLTPLLLALPAHSLPHLFARQAPVSITASQLLTIAPTSSSCTVASHPDECRTSAQAAPLISASFTKYSITCPHEAAALISLIALESGEFKFNKNYFPGNPGQGTRNMQSAAFNRMYALSIPELKDKVAEAGADPNKVRELVLPDQYSFASAAWFLTSQCSAAVRAQLKSGSMDGWKAYLTQCIGTTVSEERVKYWNKANAALGSGAL